MPSPSPNHWTLRLANDDDDDDDDDGDEVDDEDDDDDADILHFSQRDLQRCHVKSYT